MESSAIDEGSLQLCTWRQAFALRLSSISRTRGDSAACNK